MFKTDFELNALNKFFNVWSSSPAQDSKKKTHFGGQDGKSAKTQMGMASYSCSVVITNLQCFSYNAVVEWEQYESETKEIQANISTMSSL